MAFHMCQFLREESILGQQQHALFHILPFHHTVSHFHSKLTLAVMAFSSYFTAGRSMQSQVSCLSRFLLVNSGTMNLGTTSSFRHFSYSSFTDIHKIRLRTAKETDSVLKQLQQITG